MIYLRYRHRSNNYRCRVYRERPRPTIHLVTSWYILWELEAFHGKRDTYNCSIDAYISNKSRTLLIGHLSSINLALELYWVYGAKVSGSLVWLRLATISETIFNVPSITIAEINHDVFVYFLDWPIARKMYERRVTIVVILYRQMYCEHDIDYYSWK